jgi:uncharacterized coiled-coil DUF342 family protein
MTGQPLRAGASAEQRYRALLDHRDAEAQFADEARDERDMLQTRRRELIDGSKALRATRDALSNEARTHEEAARAIRARLQGTQRRAGRPRDQGSETDEEKVERLTREIAEAERRLETRPMPIAEEKRLVETTRRKKREADGLAGALAEKAGKAGKPVEASDPLPKDAEELRRMLDEAMGRAQQLRQDAQTAHDAAGKHSTDIDALSKEADLKHAKVQEHRERANEFHEKAMKLRELVIAERAKRKAEHDEGQEAMRDQASRVKDALYDEARREKEADEAVASLRAKGKLNL